MLNAVPNRATKPLSTSLGKPPIEQFGERYAMWQQLHTQHGPGRSYPYAWRLPELARPLGQPLAHQAQHALALDLYCLGRFAEALDALPPHSETEDCAECTQLRQYLHCLSTVEPAGVPLDNVYLNYLYSPPPPVHHHTAMQARLYPALIKLPARVAEPWQRLLQAWIEVRQVKPPHNIDHARLHLDLALLRKTTQCLGAQAEALFAEIQFYLDLRWSVVWLDQALDRIDSFSQHHLKARLLFLKAQALAASGELGESQRFERLAITLAERQGAQRYLALWAFSCRTLAQTEQARTSG